MRSRPEAPRIIRTHPKLFYACPLIAVETKQTEVGDFGLAAFGEGFDVVDVEVLSGAALGAAVFIA